MSTFPDVVADGRSSGKALEKSNFNLTCSLLSQFLKDKRSSRAFSLGMGGKMEPRGPGTTMDLLTNLKNSDDALRQQNASAMDCLPQFVENPCIKQSNLRSPAPEAPQMTIFYAGKVLVFDAFPPEKATEIMELATKLGSDNSGNDKNPPTSPVATENLKGVEVPAKNTDQEASRPGPQAFGSDMRYPRRASLLKFLEKRKERVIARGPYQMNNPKYEGSSSGCHPEDQSSNHFDLNL